MRSSRIRRPPRAGRTARSGAGALTVLISGLISTASVARAQHLELTGFGGIGWGGSAELANGSGDFESGPVYGGSALWRVREDGLLGLTYSREKTAFSAAVQAPGGAPTSTTIDAIISTIHAAGEVELWPTRRLTPTLGLSLGATSIQPAVGGSTSWYFSTAVSGGGKYRITDHVGLRMQLRFLVSVIGSNSAFFCVSAGGATCAVSSSVDALLLGDLVAGAYVEF